MCQHEPLDVEEVPRADAAVRILVDDLVAEELSAVHAVLAERSVEGARVGVGELVADHVLEAVVDCADVVHVVSEPSAPVERPDRWVLEDRAREPSQIRARGGAAERTSDQQQTAPDGRARDVVLVQPAPARSGSAGGWLSGSRAAPEAPCAPSGRRRIDSVRSTFCQWRPESSSIRSGICAAWARSALPSGPAAEPPSACASSDWMLEGGCGSAAAYHSRSRTVPCSSRYAWARTGPIRAVSPSRIRCAGGGVSGAWPLRRPGSRRRRQLHRGLRARQHPLLGLVAGDGALQRQHLIGAVDGVEQEQLRVAVADDDSKLRLGPFASQLPAAAHGRPEVKPQPGRRERELRDAVRLALADHVGGARVGAAGTRTAARTAARDRQQD